MEHKHQTTAMDSRRTGDAFLSVILIVALGAALTAAPPEAATAAEASTGAEAGELMAAYALTSLDGSETSLASFRGEVLVVNFWASWCAPCRKELPVMDEWNSGWAGHGARVVAISIDNELRNARRFVEEASLSMTVLYDGSKGLVETLDIPSLPCTFVLDRRGKVVQEINSSSRKDLASLRSTVESLLATSGNASVGEAGMDSGSAGMALQDENDERRKW